MGKTLLIGNFGAGNIGDELILSETLSTYPDSIVMTHDPQKSQDFCEQSFPCIGFFPTGIRSFFRFLSDKNHQAEIQKQQSSIDRVVFAGGGLFAIKIQAYFLWFLVFLWVQKYFPNAEIRFEHQGVDQPSDFLSKFFVRYALQRCDFFSVRDKHSKEAVLSLVDRKVDNVGDRVHFQRWKTAPTHSGKKILVNARAPFPIAAFQKICKEKFSNETIEILFVAFDPSDLAHGESSFFKRRILPRTKTELLELFITADIIIGERFHCLLLGHDLCGSDSTFVLRKPYAKKVSSFCQEKNIQRF